jgi:hypothetical protein
VPENDTLNYRILCFTSVFNEISKVVKCKTCGGDVKFQTESTRWLGFKIIVICDVCRPTDIPSCPKIGLSYEINRRFSFAMRCLEQGASGEKRFCGLMDLPPPVTQKSYNEIQNNIHIASKAIAQLLMKDTVQEDEFGARGRKCYRFSCFGRRDLAKARVFFPVWRVQSHRSAFEEDYRHKREIFVLQRM